MFEMVILNFLDNRRRWQPYDVITLTTVLDQYETDLSCGHILAATRGLPQHPTFILRLELCDKFGVFFVCGVRFVLQPSGTLLTSTNDESFYIFPNFCFSRF